MQTAQSEHIHEVIRLVDPHAGIAGPDIDPLIRESWSRCVHQHKLDPTRMQEAIILPSQRVREHRERIEEFLSIARHGLEAIHQQVGDLGYCVLLADARGVTVDYLGDLRLDPDLRRTGLYLGSDWNEHLAGTCAIGTAIATGQALVVHQTDHFDATHIPLTCTAAPIYDPLGHLTAVLDISALTSPQAKNSQHLALQLVKLYAHRVESANFLRWFRSDWVLKLHPSPEFVEISPDYLVALDAGGRVVGHNRAAQLLLEDAHGSCVLGLAFEQLFELRLNDLGRYLRAMPGERRAVALRGGTRLFLHAIAPPSRVVAHATDVIDLPSPLAALSGGDAALDQQLQRAARLAETEVSVLVTGETGSGKEYLARALHAASPRRDRAFVAVNCAAIPETLIESELFGHLPGAFSGAAPKGKRGLVQEADGGTLFLDEIGDMPLAMQARLLRVLAEREVLPIGATRAIKVDVRVLAATHADLPARVREGRFREDLYYRLAGAHLTLPPLRRRRDLAWLVGRFLSTSADGTQLDPAAEQRLLAYAWPGNLRELRNALDFARAMAGPGGTIGLPELPESVLAATSAAAPEAAEPTAGSGDGASPAGSPQSPEAMLLLQYLRASRWNISAVAHQMGLARMTVYRRMRRWGIRPPT
ncbi:sigma-54-dependent Fis family transcriptional regulator [Variovorax sp. YR216]|uniref:sigma-54-dependent Fis family transcriptional regulator n=1 Tax=Variovorax sp. YR216 TaxID=1882828 RepID=UPI0008998D61|nr:sigma-54-dependent Fis family transcriptional regulator [Variovorax sp. YR216]SEB09824.1 Transcriptional regulator of acetoin/glycerol metabolism [Variovorax sp. YR216]